MRKGKIIFLMVISVLLLAGCATRLGYPVRIVAIPTPVTLFAKLSSKPSLTINLDYLARDIWSTLYQKKFEEVLSKVSVDRLQRRLNLAFAQNAARSKDLFALSSSEVLDIGVEYGRTKSDPPAYSGFDFSQYKETIPSAYILALTVDDWGLIAAKKNADNGPFISLSIQLVDKETSESLWKYTYLFQQAVDKDANELTKPEKLEDILDRMIGRAVDQFFMWLGW